MSLIEPFRQVWVLERVFARALETNRASRRVLEKNGFRFVRTEPHQFPAWNPAELLAVYKVTGAQYHASRHQNKKGTP